MNDGLRLPAVPIPGLAPDCLGNYLASLGLLRLLARTWPKLRIAWCDDVLNLVGGPSNLEDIVAELACVAKDKKWTPYGRNWLPEQKKSTKAKSGKHLALWLAQSSEQELELFHAHAVPTAPVSFNPLLGSGGNSGRRDFAKGCKKAVEALGKRDPNVRPALEALLLGTPTAWELKDLNAASWFSAANKRCNNGQQPFRDGQVSPWAMALACEGLQFLAGGVSRRLGARSHAVGAFPFVTHAASPRVAGEAKRDLGEFWAPLWDRPMTDREVQTVFARGRAEVHGCGARTPCEFATAIVRRGVDAGISEFRRFVLCRTTSANTFEPRLEDHFKPPFPDSATPMMGMAATAPIERLLSLVDGLPRDRKIGERRRFEGLRGPIEAALLRLAARPNDPVAGRDVLDVTVMALDRVDRNRRPREKHVSWQPLPIEWLPALFRDQEPPAEARLAMALVSGFPRSRPFTLYRFGVERERQGNGFRHLDRAPSRWVWGPGVLPRVLTAVLLRRTLDWEAAHEKHANGEEPVRGLLPAAPQHVSHWIDDALDQDLLARWLSRLALFDWGFVPREVSKLAGSNDIHPVACSGLCLFGLFQPLFDLRPVKLRGVNSGVDLLAPECGARTPAAARRVANLINTDQVDSAVRFALSRYAMARAPLVRTNAPWRVSDHQRLLASLLFTIPNRQRGYLVQRWLRPQRQTGESIHV